MPAAGRCIDSKRHGDELSQGQQAIVVFVFRLNNGRDYGLVTGLGQSACSFPNRRLDGKSFGLSCAP